MSFQFRKITLTEEQALEIFLDKIHKKVGEKNVQISRWKRPGMNGNEPIFEKINFPNYASEILSGRLYEMHVVAPNISPAKENYATHSEIYLPKGLTKEQLEFYKNFLKGVGNFESSLEFGVISNMQVPIAFAGYGFNGGTTLYVPQAGFFSKKHHKTNCLEFLFELGTDYHHKRSDF